MRFEAHLRCNRKQEDVLLMDEFNALMEAGAWITWSQLGQIWGVFVLQK